VPSLLFVTWCSASKY